jgi:hypothetical protein
VNKEIDNYNRRLGKHLKGFDHVNYKVLNYERKLHTKHGLHLNTLGKEYAASQLVSLISSIEKDTSKVERDIIPLAPYATPSSTMQLHNGLPENSGVRSRNISEASSPGPEMTQPTKRKRRPIARNEDFLWE